MTTLAAVRAGLAARLETIDGLRTTAFDPDTVNPPAAIVSPPETIEYDLAQQRGLDLYVFKVKVLTSRATAKGGQDDLCAFLEPHGARSVKAAVEGDRQTGVGCLFTDGVPAADEVRVTGADESGVYVVGNTAYFGAVWSVVVYARGDAA